VPANEKLGPGDRFINEQLDAFPRAKKVAIVTKMDAASRPEITAQLLAVQALRDWDDIIPISSISSYKASREQLDILTTQLIRLMPLSEPLYPVDAVTDETLTARVAELIREAALEGVSEELPHSIAVTIDDMIEREDKELVEIYANLFVERDSQKGIIIGHQGERLQDVGARARVEIEKLVGKQVFLSMRVKVAKDWQRDAKQLGRLGF
jgi:GTP-binding protein Era